MRSAACAFRVVVAVVKDALALFKSVQRRNCTQWSCTQDTGFYLGKRIICMQLTSTLPSRSHTTETKVTHTLASAQQCCWLRKNDCLYDVFTTLSLIHYRLSVNVITAHIPASLISNGHTHTHAAKLSVKITPRESGSLVHLFFRALMTSFCTCLIPKCIRIPLMKRIERFAHEHTYR